MFDDDEVMIVDESKISATKKYIHKWGFMINLIIGIDDTLTQHQFSQEYSHSQNIMEMKRLYEMGLLLKQWLENMRYGSQSNLNSIIRM